MEHYNHNFDVQFNPDISDCFITMTHLGNTIEQMKRHWTSLHLQGQSVFLTEFPTVDVNQIVDPSTGLTLMDFTLDILAMVQEQRRQAVRKKQAQGIQKARAKGIRLGRRPLEIPEQFFTFLPLIQQGNMTITAASRILAVDYKTVRKWVSMQERMGE